MKRGSALLIVLGMLAVMVISAVAFSAYMRYNRLPSSFLRRTSASRHLAKAALAEAIDEIDAAIGNNPHPGVGTLPYRYDADANDRTSGQTVNRNGWMHRVFLGTNVVNEADAQNKLVAEDSTVSTLTLEGLAYIPPPLVNEARYYSRRSRAAQWKDLAYDAGRYAFCAIDVSDYFDVNALAADVPRSSSPSQRISLAYLFENDDHTAATGNGGSPGDWDEFIGQFLEDGQVPLVSMADWNLAVNKDMPCALQSQFCEYVKGRSDFYGTTENTAEADKIRRQTFVTDSWFPEPTVRNKDEDDYDLMDEKYQPFEKSQLDGSSVPSLVNFIKNPSSRTDSLTRLFERINVLGIVALFDYLDQNKVPLSLALPTVERVPMICGIQPALAGTTLKIQPDTPEITAAGATIAESALATATETDPPTRDVVYRLRYKLSGLAPLKNSQIVALATYPFAHDAGVPNGTFDVDGRLSLFLTSADMGLRTSSLTDVLHVEKDGDFSLADTDASAGVIRVPLNFGSLQKSSFGNNGNIQTEREAVKMVMSPLTQLKVGEVADFLTVTYTWTQTKQKTPGDPPQYSYDKASLAAASPAIADATCAFPPLAANGVADADFANGARLVATLSGGTKTRLKLNAAITVRVKHNDAFMGLKTVDLVPACIMDDQLNGVNNKTAYQALNGYYGEAYPVLRFDAGVTVDLSAVATYGAPALDPAAGTIALNGGNGIMVADPRYNFAPESWFEVAGLNEDKWLTECHRQDNNRDGDIFMAVSDQGFLQSVYELANLPRLTDFDGNYQGELDGFFKRPSAPVSGFVGQDSGRRFAATFADTANNGVMWKTYNPFPGSYLNDGDDFAGAGFCSVGRGFKVNPYSNSTNTILAALANAPHEWSCASTNYDSRIKTISQNMSAEQFNAKYAWNDYSSGSGLCWEDIEYVASAFIEDMHQGNATPNWETVWRNLGWHRANAVERSQYILDFKSDDAGAVSADGTGGNLHNVWNCDKKFLYGFWHDSFGVRQQLFLVFVRAEPQMMGGGSVRQTPPSLGSRAVALVWRDPAATEEDVSGQPRPHQTRILFYRQFD